MTRGRCFVAESFVWFNIFLILLPAERRRGCKLPNLAISLMRHDRKKARPACVLAGVAAAGLCITALALWLTYILWFMSLDSPLHGDVSAATPAKAPAPSSLPLDIGDAQDAEGLFQLHPEDHVHRDPKTIRLVWNVTQETLSPDGVVKNVYMINGMLVYFASCANKQANSQDLSSKQGPAMNSSSRYTIPSLTVRTMGSLFTGTACPCTVCHAHARRS